MMKDDAVYLHHMLESIAEVEQYLSGKSEDEFYRSGLLQSGVVRQLEIIGEACNYLSEAFRHQRPEVDWGDIIGMRNRIIHAYFDVNYTIVWEVAQNDLPILKKQVERFLAELKS
jgi:uncharacterized protein with HEPN domain